MLDLRRWTITVFKQLVGFERSRVHINGKPYLDRWIIYFGLGTLRLHKFWRGDDDRAPHDHPWNFITFPLTTYYEEVDHFRDRTNIREVKAWRPHYRAAYFRHIVLGSDWAYSPCHDRIVGSTAKPFYTLVVTGNRIRGWGFWPEWYAHNVGKYRKFVPWREWK